MAEQRLFKRPLDEVPPGPLRDIRERITAARMEYERAAKAYCETVREAVPQGSLVTAELGRAIVEIEVTGHSVIWWSSPGEIIGINTVTGKQRHFYPTNIMSVTLP